MHYINAGKRPGFIKLHGLVILQYDDISSLIKYFVLFVNLYSILADFVSSEVIKDFVHNYENMFI